MACACKHPGVFRAAYSERGLIIEAFFTEFVLGKSLRVYEKGH